MQTENFLSTEMVFLQIISVLEYDGCAPPFAHAESISRRLTETLEVYDNLLRQMEPVFAFRAAVIHLTTPTAQAALNRHTNSRTQS